MKQKCQGEEKHYIQKQPKRINWYWKTFKKSVEGADAMLHHQFVGMVEGHTEGKQSLHCT